MLLDCKASLLLKHLKWKNYPESGNSSSSPRGTTSATGSFAGEVTKVPDLG